MSISIQKTILQSDNLRACYVTNLPHVVAPLRRTELPSGCGWIRGHTERVGEGLQGGPVGQQVVTLLIGGEEGLPQTAHVAPRGPPVHGLVHLVSPGEWWRRF